MIDKFVRKNIVLKEVRDLVGKLVEKLVKGKEKARIKFEKDIMKTKLLDAQFVMKDSRRKMIRSKKSLDEVVRKNTFVRDEYIEVVNTEVAKVWKEEKKIKENKIIFNEKKMKNRGKT